MPKPIALDTPCGACGKNEWWDNTTTKKNPKMPDFKCANKECRDPETGYPGARWLPKGHKTAPAVSSAPKGGRLTGDDTTPDERGENVASWEALCYTYGVLFAKVWASIDRQAAKVGHQVDQNAVQAGVATLLIQGEKARIPLLHPRKAEPVPMTAVIPPKRKPDTKPGLDEFPEGLEPEEWEPPF